MAHTPFKKLGQTFHEAAGTVPKVPTVSPRAISRAKGKFVPRASTT